MLQAYSKISLASWLLFVESKPSMILEWSRFRSTFSGPAELGSKQWAHVSGLRPHSRCCRDQEGGPILSPGNSQWLQLRLQDQLWRWLQVEKSHVPKGSQCSYSWPIVWKLFDKEHDAESCRLVSTGRRFASSVKIWYVPCIVQWIQSPGGKLNRFSWWCWRNLQPRSFGRFTSSLLDPICSFTFKSPGVLLVKRKSETKGKGSNEKSQASILLLFQGSVVIIYPDVFSTLYL